MNQPITQESTSRTVETPDWTIHYNEAGPTDAPVLVFLHGSGPGATGWSNFQDNLPELAKDFRVIAPDMPGWGRSSAVTRDEQDHAEAAVQLLDALDLERATFVGNSMGGITALRLVTEYPERVERIITMGPGSGTVPISQPGGGLSEGMKVLLAGYREPTAASMKALVQVMTYDSERFGTDELAEQRAEAARANPEHLTNYLEAFAAGGPIAKWPNLDALADVAVPALLIHGRDDRVVHFEHSLHLLARIPDSRLVLLNRCGHWAQVEHADEFNRVVRDFMLAAA